MLVAEQRRIVGSGPHSGASRAIAHRAKLRCFSLTLNAAKSPATRRAFCFCTSTLHLQRDGRGGTRSRCPHRGSHYEAAIVAFRINDGTGGSIRCRRDSGCTGACTWETSPTDANCGGTSEGPSGDSQTCACSWHYERADGGVAEYSTLYSAGSSHEAVSLSALRLAIECWSWRPSTRRNIAASPRSSRLASPSWRLS